MAERRIKVSVVRRIVKEFQRGWCPYSAGGTVGVHAGRVKNVRPAAGLERCCYCVCHDPQSGTIYCGDLADVVADVVTGKSRCGGDEKPMGGYVVAYCEAHRGAMRKHRQET